MSIYIKNALWDGSMVNVTIEGNSIVAIGENVPIPQDAMVIDGTNKALFPTLANAHTHAPMTLFRSYGDDNPLQVWLEEWIWPKEKQLNEDIIYWGTRLACLEMIKSGCTAFNDMYFFLPQEAQAIEDSDIRAMLGHTLFGDADELMQDRFNPIPTQSSRVKYCLAPHAIYTVTETGLLRAAQFCSLHQMNYHIHMSETLKEVNDCIAQHNCRPYEYLEKLGILEMLEHRFVGAHSLHLSEKEITILGKYHGNVVHNPNSNLKLGSGHQFLYKELKDAGVNITLGTDGCSSSNNLDMIEAMKVMALLQKGWRNNPTIMPTQEAFSIGSTNGYNMMGWNGGRIAVGALADIMLVDLSNIAFIPNNNTLNNLIYAAHGDCVDTVICDGKVVMHHRKVTDEDIIIKEAQRCAKELLK